MRILIVTTDFLPNVSGIATLSYEQAVGLARQGHDVHVVTTREDAITQNADGAITIHYYANTHPPVWRLLRFYQIIHRAIKAIQPNVIWCSNYRGFGLPVYLLARLHQIPYGLYLHGTELLTENKSRLRKAVLRVAGRNARYLVTNSSNTARVLSHLYGLTANVVTPGVHPPCSSNDLTSLPGDHPLEQVTQWLRQKHATSEFPRIIFLAACRVSRQKGLHTAIQAIASLPTHIRRQVVYIIAGTGPDLAALQQQIEKLGLTDSVFFAGPLSRCDIPVFLRMGDVYLQPSQPDGDFLESYGISFLEAQMVGKPCIASNWGGIPEAVIPGETAILVPPGSVNALAEAITRVISDHQWRATASAAAVRWANDNTWANHAEKLQNLITGNDLPHSESAHR